MLKQIARLKVVLILLLGTLLFFSGACAMEMRSRGDNRRGYRGDDSREERHYYRDGRWYKHDSRGNEIAVDILAIGVFIESLPPQHKTVVIQGSSYYHDGRYYYKRAPHGGYTVVSPPQSNYDKQGERGRNAHNEQDRGENRR